MHVRDYTSTEKTIEEDEEQEEHISVQSYVHRGNSNSSRSHKPRWRGLGPLSSHSNRHEKNLKPLETATARTWAAYLPASVISRRRFRLATTPTIPRPKWPNNSPKFAPLSPVHPQSINQSINNCSRLVTDHHQSPPIITPSPNLSPVANTLVDVSIAVYQRQYINPDQSSKPSPFIYTITSHDLCITYKSFIFTNQSPPIIHGTSFIIRYH